MNKYEIMIDAFGDELRKIASAQLTDKQIKILKSVGLAAGGAAGYEALRTANNDRRTGRAVRMQQGF